MPHLPGHNRPFTSFLTQGMRNTNQNINNMNQPGLHAGFGGFHESGGGGWGEPGGSTGPGGLGTPGFGMEGINPIGQEGEGFITPEGKYPSPPSTIPFGSFMTPQDQYRFNTTPVIDTPGGEGFDLSQPKQPYENPSKFIESVPSGPGMIPGYNVGNTDYDDRPQLGGASQAMPTEELPQGFQWQFINNEWIPVDVTAGEGASGENPFTPGLQPGLGNELDFTDYTGGDYLSAPDAVSSDVYGDNWEWVYDESMNQWTQEFTDPGLGGGFDFGGGLDMGGTFDFGFGGMTEDIENAEHAWLDSITGASPTFTGGGGQAGQAAKRLYFPGTSGGFAGVGSGIKPGSFQDLLSRR